MSLTRHCLVRAYDGRYIDASCGLTRERAKAARLSLVDARECLSLLRQFDRHHVLRSASIEETSKAERRLWSPLDGNEFAAMRLAIKSLLNRTRLADLEREIEGARRTAAFYEAKAVELRALITKGDQT